jgi:hypothetical protein
MNFLLSEDEALKNLLKGMTVTDQKAGSTQSTTRPVKVWFGQPDQEITAQMYPYITIDMIDVAEDFMRAMRGKAQPYYMSPPATMPDEDIEFDPDVNDWEVDYPIPVNIDYQITVYSRQPRHDRAILAQLLQTKIPLRFAVLDTGDGTTRRLDVLDVSKRDITESGKRLFVNAITVRVSSEIQPSVYREFYKVSQVNLTGTIGVFTQGSTGYPFEAVESFTLPE